MYFPSAQLNTGQFDVVILKITVACCSIGSAAAAAAAAILEVEAPVFLSTPL